MFTETEMHDLFERVLGKMLVAGWLSSFTFTKDKGWWRNWTLSGNETKESLALVIKVYRLHTGEIGRSPVAFRVAAQSGSFDAAPLAEVEKEDARFFAARAEELGISGEDEHLTMVRICLME